MYLALYLDGEVEEGKELFLTQLIKPGSGIESLKTTKKLESGNYDTTLVFTQVKDDHKTIQSQVSVAYTLMVD
jgi:hypothetical protein